MADAVTLVLVTAPPEAADELARTLVEERLAACVNRIDCRSTYRWDGAVHDDEEVLLAIKTTDARHEDLRARVEALHPYDLPAIERVETTPGRARLSRVAQATLRQGMYSTLVVVDRARREAEWGPPAPSQEARTRTAE